MSEDEEALQKQIMGTKIALDKIKDLEAQLSTLTAEAAGYRSALEGKMPTLRGNGHLTTKELSEIENALANPSEATQRIEAVMEKAGEVVKTIKWMIEDDDWNDNEAFDELSKALKDQEAGG